MISLYYQELLDEINNLDFLEIVFSYQSANKKIEIKARTRLEY